MTNGGRKRCGASYYCVLCTCDLYGAEPLTTVSCVLATCTARSLLLLASCECKLACDLPATSRRTECTPGSVDWHHLSMYCALPRSSKRREAVGAGALFGDRPLVAPPAPTRLAPCGVCPYSARCRAAPRADAFLLQKRSLGRGLFTFLPKKFFGDYCLCGTFRCRARCHAGRGREPPHQKGGARTFLSPRPLPWGAMPLLFFCLWRGKGSVSAHIHRQIGEVFGRVGVVGRSVRFSCGDKFTDDHVFFKALEMVFSARSGGVY